MTGTAPLALIEFTGRVDCRRRGAHALMLSGREGAVPLVVHLGAVRAADIEGLPGELENVRLVERPAHAEGQRSLELQSGSFSRLLQVRGLQVHRDAARAFFAAVPPVPVPALRRAGWSALLLLLRVPGMAGLLKRLREST